LRRTDDPKAKAQAHGHPGRNEEVQDRNSEPAEKEGEAGTKAESPLEEPRKEEAFEQKNEGAESENASSDSDSEGAPTPSSPVSEQGGSNEMDDSRESVSFEHKNNLEGSERRLTVLSAARAEAE
jgi:hypothetical protein